MICPAVWVRMVRAPVIVLQYSSIRKIVDRLIRVLDLNVFMEVVMRNVLVSHSLRMVVLIGILHVVRLLFVDYMMRLLFVDNLVGLLVHNVWLLVDDMRWRVVNRMNCMSRLNVHVVLGSFESHSFVFCCLNLSDRFLSDNRTFVFNSLDFCSHLMRWDRLRFTMMSITVHAFVY